ncbi:YbaK/EbsC family protein [Novacetimonas hansenii]|uniref:hypothetical protein n=1 Tax=Novacetimonas hansenii TaxID=436 RepID=UPI0007999B97|nr:hypothetical protein [Novacetimonas hansenii]WEQ60499.1 hypothetical protein LV563_07675 [Novacetimonas hansenii]CUW48832.1 Putative prolyl tRNA synthetase [Novacetimonas hansenii]
MSLNSVKAFFRQHAADIEIVEFDVCTATVASAADTLEVPQGQIAKNGTISTVTLKCGRSTDWKTP